KPNVFTVARPVHRLAANVRNSKEENDSYASAVVYGWMAAVDPDLLREIRDFIEVSPEDPELDLPSLALAILGADVLEDLAGDEETAPTPVCRRQAVAFCQDLRSLLAYRGVMPRSSLVEHIGHLIGFHLGTYLLRTFRIVSDIEQRRGKPRACSECWQGVTP